MSSETPLLRRPTTLSLLTLAGLLLGVGLPLLMGAGEGTTSDLAANRARIAGMTALERKRLETRADRFDRLEESERSRLRDMHEAIAGDPELEATLATYRTWLATLTPLQRDALRAETNPQDRLAMVQRYRDEQREDERRRFHWPGRGGPRGGPPRPSVDPAELEPIYTVLLDGLDEADRKTVEAAESPLVRHLRTVQLHWRKWFRAQQPRNRERWPDSKTLAAIVAALPENSYVRGELEEEDELDDRRGRLAGFLMGNVFRELSTETQKRAPTDEQLFDFYTGLPDQDRDDLVGLPPDDFQNELRKRYAMESMKDVPELKSVMQLLGNLRFGGRPQFGGRGRGDGGGRDGGRGDNGGRNDGGRGGQRGNGPPPSPPVDEDGQPLPPPPMGARGGPRFGPPRNAD